MGTIASLLVLVADLYAIYHIVTSAASTGKKVLWALGVLVFPVLGFLAWLFFGPRSARGVA